MRPFVIVLATLGGTLAIVWIATQVLPSTAHKPSAAQAAAAAKVDRDYRVLVHRLRVRAHRVQRIKAARGAWARRANGICGRELRALARAAAPIRTNGSKAELRNFMSNVDSIEGRSLAELQALRRPWQDRARVRKFLALSGQAQSLLHEMFSAIQSHDRRSFVRVVHEDLQVRRRADAIATALGADVCAEGPFSSELG